MVVQVGAVSYTHLDVYKRQVNVPFSGANSVSCGTSSFLYDNGGPSGDYASGSNGYTVLENSGTGVISMSGSYTYMEGSWDFLRIYSGVGTSGTLLYTCLLYTSISYLIPLIRFLINGKMCFNDFFKHFIVFVN